DVVEERPDGEPPAPAVPRDLSLGVLPSDVQARIAGPAPEGELRSKPRRPSVDELRAELARAEEGAANVRVGRVDPLLYDYLRGARSRFEEEAHRLAGGLSLRPGATVSSWGGRL